MFRKEKECKLSAPEIEQRAVELLGQMTLKEKVWLLNGNWEMLTNGLRFNGNFYNPEPIKTNGLKRLGIPPIKFTDGPRGVVMGKATCFPVSMARGASFDRVLEKKIGDVIGKEARALGANYFGGVCINILRHPAWGRAQETYSEDPYLLGEMGSALTESVQAHNVIACAKHYALNNIENSRFFVNVKVDERSLREVYLPHFKKAVDAGAASIMGAYNLYEGNQACESKHLLTEILRDDWGFEGFTISDFIFGVRNTKKAIEAGLDVEMPLPIHYQKKLLKAVKSGIVDETLVDQAVLRVVKTLLVFENCPDKLEYSRELVTHPDHIALAREAAEKSMVLIKNENAALPLDKHTRKILLLGRLANQENTGDHGSSQVYPPYVVTPLDGLKHYLGDEAEIIHLDEHQIDQAKKLAPEVDCIIIVAGNDFSDEGEYISPGSQEEFFKPVIKGYKNMGKPFQTVLMKIASRLRNKKMQADAGGDRQCLSLKPAEIELIKAVSGLNPNTIVVLVCGSMIMIDDWAARVPAILYGWYSGMEGGNALARILFGDANPCGKLPFSIPQETGHLPYFSSSDKEIQYDFYHGYTLLDKNGHKPAYPFGFGLSYTHYTYQELKLEKSDDHIMVTVTVTNDGAVDGEEIVQVYAGMEKSKVERHHKLLKGFEKVFIPTGKSVEVKIPVRIDELRVFNTDRNRWELEPGSYTIMAGASSNEGTLLKGKIELE
ncbi:MAG: glycoside hydrolase family 3 C-terminal domain-containing protein [Anaerolineales bacterium]|nr:glycoside hydrolase family 3 C-terminal domain-containing protein [Anaerolineales bacterium]